MNIKEKALDLFDSAKEPATEIACSLLLEGVVGTVVPGMVSSVLAYKQKRQEKMFEAFMIELKERISILEERLVKLEPEKLQEIKEKYFGLVSDYALDEVQEEKIKYIANGFLNLAAMPEVNEDFVLMYYDTLKQLRIQDLVVLKFYYELYTTDKTYIDILNELNIEYKQYESIRERLLRLGLLSSKREEKEDDLYKNIQMLQDTVEKILKGTKVNSFKPKSLDKKDSMLISKFGKEFIVFFMNNSNQ
ncbi:MAG: hypothetical protein E7211_20510 [Clostridium lundense]|nr:hypothetical protein [Clostridium lundense]